MAIDYNAIAEAGGIPKTYSPNKERKATFHPSKSEGPKRKTKLKSKSKPIPKAIKEAVLEQKGRLCLLGFCEHCGGTAVCTIDDDFHHKPKRSHGGKNIVEHLYPAKRLCHDYYETHPLEEKEMFRRMEAAGIPVVWKVPTKGGN